MPRRRTTKSLLTLFLVALIGIGAMAGGLGYLVGQYQAGSGRQFSRVQQEFIAGLVQGTKIRDDDKPSTVLRAGCAGLFYPSRPDAMAGCVAGLSDAPRMGYHLPPG